MNSRFNEPLAISLNSEAEFKIERQPAIVPSSGQVCGFRVRSIERPTRNADCPATTNITTVKIIFMDDSSALINAALRVLAFSPAGDEKLVLICRRWSLKLIRFIESNSRGRGLIWPSLVQTDRVFCTSSDRSVVQSGVRFFDDPVEIVQAR